MFKSIKEFFVGKPKVEEPPAECPYMAEVIPVGTEATIVASSTTTAAVSGEQAQPAPITITPETVVISISDNMNVSVGSQSDTITLTPPVANSGAWPFPTAAPLESVVKKTTTPAIKATKKPRKKK